MYFIIENQLFPVLNYYNYSFNKKYIKLLSCEVYQKTSFRNRYVVAGSNGLIHLSVPLEKGRDQKIQFKDVRICQRQNWQLVHWRTLTSCYNKSPFFDHYAGGLERFFGKRWAFLFDWNLSILHWLKEILRHPPEILVSDQMDADSVNPDAEDFRNRWLPRNFQDCHCPLVYPQVFEDRIGFQKNLSVLDLLFNEGPVAGTLIERAANAMDSF